MKKWELARYLVDAKKSVDAIMYISGEFDKFKYLSIRELISSHRQVFYINCGVILDEVFVRQKKDLCKRDSIAKEIYYERDKNSAHKDYNYEHPKYEDVAGMAIEMQKQLIHVRDICSEKLPVEVTLDFVPHNPILFRLVNGITLEVEEKIKMLLHPQYNPDVIDDYDGHPIFEDTEDIRSIQQDEKKNFMVIFKEGINLFESLQNRQDGCILANVLHDLNMWCSLKLDENQKLDAIIEIDLKEMEK